MEYEKFRKFSLNERNEYATSLTKAIEEQRKLCEALAGKRDQSALDAKSKPEVVAMLGEQLREANKKLQRLEQGLHEFQRMMKQCEMEDSQEGAYLISDRDSIGGALFSGSGSVHIRTPKILKPANAITYKDIIEESKKREANENDKRIAEIITAVTEKLEPKK